MNLFVLKKFLQKLKLATIQKKLYMTAKKSIDLNDILQILQKEHLILGYSENQNDIKFFLRYDVKGDSVIQNIKTVSSLKQRIIINNHQIKAFINDYPYATGLIRTRRGILNIRECSSYKVGGEFLVFFT